MKPVDPKDRSTGINFASAREWLKGLPERRLDSDWVAVDMEGHVAFFAGNEVGPIPNDADVERVGEVHEALARARRATQSVAEMPEGYRRPADHANEPIFDVPVTPLGGPAHEGPADGYPLLVVGTQPGLREKATRWNTREALARDGFGIVFASLTPAEHLELHRAELPSADSTDTSSRRWLCEGCRVLDDPNDPRPCAPELLAAAGLYVYVHTSEDEADPYRRVAGPSVAADLADLESIVQLVASRVKLDVSFEDEEALQPRDLLPCRP